MGLKDCQWAIIFSEDENLKLKTVAEYSMSNPVAPAVRWAQRKERVLVTIGVIDGRDPVLKIEGNKLTFSGKAGEASYALNLGLFNDIDVTASRYVVRPRGIEISLAKKDTAVWWPRLTKATTKLYYLTVDWSRWVDSSDDEPSKPEFNWDPSETGTFDDAGADDHDHDHDHHDHSGCSCSHHHDAAAPAEAEPAPAQEAAEPPEAD
jgi:hypothetical protein